MFTLLEKEFLSPEEANSYRMVQMMLKPGSGYDNLQYSYSVSQEYSRYQPFDISHGRFAQMKDAGMDVYNGWMVDAFAPPEFWLARRKEILEGKALDSAKFVPLLPDLYNLKDHPRAVIKAAREWISAKKRYGDHFQFVFTCDEQFQYYKFLYMFIKPQDPSVLALTP